MSSGKMNAPKITVQARHADEFQRQNGGLAVFDVRFIRTLKNIIEQGIEKGISMQKKKDEAGGFGYGHNREIVLSER